MIVKSRFMLNEHSDNGVYITTLQNEFGRWYPMGTYKEHAESLENYCGCKVRKLPAERMAPEEVAEGWLYWESK